MGNPSPHNQRGVEPHIGLAEVDKTMETVVGAPRIFSNEIAVAAVVVGQSHECHGVIVGGLEALESLLALLLRDVLRGEDGHSAGEIETF